jgi:hypothetical protein
MSCPTTAAAKSTKPWRDILPVHPAAEADPNISDEALLRMGQNILARGLQYPIEIFRAPGKPDSLLCGVGRLDAMVRAGVPFRLYKHKGEWYLEIGDAEVEVPCTDFTVALVTDEDPYAYVVSSNLHSRDHTAAQKRDAIAKLLKADPGRSNLAIAKLVKADDKTVASVRKDLEARSEIPNVTSRTDTKGRQQPAAKPKAKTDATDKVEASAEARKAAYAAEKQQLDSARANADFSAPNTLQPKTKIVPSSVDPAASGAMLLLDFFNSCIERDPQLTEHLVAIATLSAVERMIILLTDVAAQLRAKQVPTVDPELSEPAPRADAPVSGDDGLDIPPSLRRTAYQAVPL